MFALFACGPMPYVEFNLIGVISALLVAWIITSHKVQLMFKNQADV